jgi:hypothetical protein
VIPGCASSCDTWLCCFPLLPQEEIPTNEAHEHSELLAYKAMVLQEGGQLQDALNLLEQSKV